MDRHSSNERAYNVHKQTGHVLEVFVFLCLLPTQVACQWSEVGRLVRKSRMVSLVKMAVIQPVGHFEADIQEKSLVKEGPKLSGEVGVSPVDVQTHAEVESYEEKYHLYL